MDPIEARLALCWLSRLERTIIRHLYGVAGRRIMFELLDMVEAQTGQPVGEAAVRHTLSRLVEVGILESRRGPHGGHCLARRFRDFLACQEAS